MITTTSDPLLMSCSVDALRRKLTDPASTLAPWWQQVLTLARQEPRWFSPYTVLAAVVTDEPEYRELARQAFLSFVALRDEGDTSNEAQYHTHVTGAPLGRWAIFYDWVADMHLFTPEEDASIRQAMLDFAFLYPLQQLQARIRSFDNQIMSNAFGAAATGYVFGVKHGDDALGRKLFNNGLAWLQDLLGRLPAGGYSPEGSTYHEQVVQPLTLLSSLFVQETTGVPVIEQGLPPTGRPVKEILNTSFRMIGPDGILPAWDAYGFQAATIKSGLAYLARINGNPAPLAVIRDCRMWYRLAHPAWEIDDRMWTLVFWPEESATTEAAYPCWMEPKVGGALQMKERQLRLFQYWDECGGAPMSGRAQVDPNAITLQAFNSPILLDGSGHPGREIIPLPEELITEYIGERTIESVKEYIHSAWGAFPSTAEAIGIAMDGAVGMSNSLVIDGENWYVPLAPRVGQGEALRTIGTLAQLRSDATGHYTDRYDVTRVKRTSLLVRGRYTLVTDHVNSTTPHAITWQAYLREQAQAEAGRVAVHTPEQVRCDIIPLQDGTLEMTPVTGYPRIAENRSVLMRHTLPAGAETRIDVLLAPQSLLTPLADLTAGWQRAIADQIATVSLETAYLTDPATQPDTPRIYTRQFTLTPELAKRYFLTLAIANSGLRLTVNGQPVAACAVQERGTWSQSATCLPWVFDITAALQAGDNTLTFTAPFFHGESLLGPAHLSVAHAPQPVEVTRTGPDSFSVTFEGDTDLLLVEHHGGACAWAGGVCDASAAHLTADGTLSAIGVSQLTLPNGLCLHSQAPCDLNWSADRTALQHVIDGSQLELAWPQGRLLVEIGGCVEVTYHGEKAHELTVELPSRRTVVVNGVVVGQFGGAQPISHTITLTPASAVASIPATVAEVYVLAERAGEAAADALIAALQGDDWKVQVAAADVLGRLAIRDAVPALLARFAESEAELPYPPLTKWWRWSKMLRNPNAVEGADPDLPRPLGIKRWRVKRAVVTALGKIGDARAVAPLEIALARCDDFFPVGSQLGVALGRLGSPSSMPVLARHHNHAEINIRVHTRLSLALLQGEIDRATFEARVGIG